MHFLNLDIIVGVAAIHCKHGHLPENSIEDDIHEGCNDSKFFSDVDSC